MIVALFDPPPRNFFSVPSSGWCIRDSVHKSDRIQVVTPYDHVTSLVLSFGYLSSLRPV
jgi:hypothetical protein